jgi:O-antigen/teichoic acid export membrane protein
MEESKMIHRDFQGNILLVLVLNAIIKPLYLLGIDRGVQNVLSPEAYGVYFTLFNLLFIFQIVADVGLQAWLTRTCAQNTSEAKNQYPYFISLKAILSLIYLLVSGIAAVILGFASTYPLFLALMLLLQLSNSFLLFLRAALSGIGLYRTDSYLSIADRGLCILLMGIFLMIPVLHSSITIILFTGIQLLSILTASGIAVMILQKHNFSFRPRFDLIKLKALFKEGLPYATLVLLMSASSRVDTILIPFFSPEKFNGAAIYAGSFRVVEAVNIIGYLFAGLLLPLFTKSIQQLDMTAKLADIAIRLLWTMMIPLAFSFSIFSAGIIPLLYKNATGEMIFTFSIAILTIIPISGNYIYGTLLTASGSLWPMNRIFVLIFCLNLVLIMLLLPLLSIPGVALASFITQTVTFIMQLKLCLNKQLVKPSFLLIRRIFIFSLIMGFCIISVHFFLSFTPANLPMLLFIGLLCTAFSMLATGMIKKNEWQPLFEGSSR